MGTFAGGHLSLVLLSVLPWLLLIAGAVVIAVLGLRTLASIARSLQEIAAQGRSGQAAPLDP